MLLIGPLEYFILLTEEIMQTFLWFNETGKALTHQFSLATAKGINSYKDGFYVVMLSIIIDDILEI